MTRWAIWGVLLVLTNGAGTLTSRARNTPSYAYHGLTAMLNHGVWFVVNVMFVGVAVDIGAFNDYHKALWAWGYYTACSTVGSIGAHYVSIQFIERGRRRVGAYYDRQDHQAHPSE